MQKAVGRVLMSMCQRQDKILRLHQQCVCLLLSAFCLLGVTGCVHRSLTITTDPPGAMVYVNDQLKGESPLTYDFVWYGWHRVLVRKEGYERVEERKELRAPIYCWIPMDLVMELLPFSIRDVRTWSYALTPSAAPANPIPPALLRSEQRERRPPPSERQIEASDAAGTTEADSSHPSPSIPPTGADQ